MITVFILIQEGISAQAISIYYLSSSHSSWGYALLYFMLCGLGHSITQLFKFGDEKSIHVVGVRINSLAKLHGRMKSAKIIKDFKI